MKLAIALSGFASLLFVAAFGSPSADAAEAVSAAPACPYRPTHEAPLAMSPDDYPLLSVAEGEQGNVVLDFEIRPDGSISDVNVAKSSGFVRLDGAAVDAASQRWHFEPILVDGKAISCRYKVAVAWRLGFENLLRHGFAVVHPDSSDYPPGSLARQEQGQMLAMAMIGPTGKILDVRVIQSTGLADLDEATKKLIASGKWPVTPATVSGKPVTSSVGLVIIWSPDGR